MLLRTLELWLMVTAAVVVFLFALTVGPSVLSIVMFLVALAFALYGIRLARKRSST